MKLLPSKPSAKSSSEPAQVLREAKAHLEKAKTYENAVEVQRAERQLRDWRKLNIKEVTP
jgi:hypothetical protein